MSKLLINERPMMLLPSLAEKIGHDHAIVLQQIQYWLATHEESENERTFRGDRWWVFNSAEDWQKKQFRWWSVSTVTRILSALEKMGLICSARFDSADWNQRKWYSINYDAVAMLEDLDIQGWQLSRQDLIEAVADALKPSKTAFSQIDQIDPLNAAKSIDSDWPDHLCKETTLKDCSKRLQKTDNVFCEKRDARDSDFDLNGQNESRLSPSAAKQIKKESSSLVIDPSERTSVPPPKNAQKPKLRYDDRGLFQFPSTGKYKQPSALAMKSLQLELGVNHLDFDLAEDEDGELIVWVDFDMEWLPADEIYPLGKIIDLALHETAANLLDIDEYNDRAIELLEYWEQYCGDNRRAGRLTMLQIANLLELEISDGED
jgi:hypothetical protein